MKKIFTIAVMAAAALTAQAVTLWEGSCSFTNWNPVEGDERPVLTTSDFANAVVGDQIILSVSEYGTDSWREAQIYEWNGSGTGKVVVSSGNISGMTQVVFTIDDTLLATLKTTDVCVIGTGYTVTKVDLSTYDGTIWEGECVCANWDATPEVLLQGSAFVNAKLGDELVFYVETLVAGEWTAIQIDNGSTHSAGPFGSHQIAEGQTEVRIVLTADLLASLQTDGINITGMNFKLTKIMLVSGGTEEPPTGNTGVIWEGTMSAGDWANYITLGADAFGTVAAGDLLAFTVTEGNAESSIALKQALPTGWEEMPSDAGEYGNYIYITDGPGVYYFTVNAAAAQSMMDYGLVVAGSGYTLTKIELLTKGVSSGVDAFEAAPAADGPVYNLNGIKVADRKSDVRTPGLYIVGGKKLIIK